MNALPFIHQSDRVAPKASDVSAVDCLYQHTWKNKIFLHVCCYGFSLGRKSLCNTAVYMINLLFQQQHFKTTRFLWSKGYKTRHHKMQNICLFSKGDCTKRSTMNSVQNYQRNLIKCNVPFQFFYKCLWVQSCLFNEPSRKRKVLWSLKHAGWITIWFGPTTNPRINLHFY